MLKHTSGYDDILLRVQQMKHNTLMLDKRNGGRMDITGMEVMGRGGVGARCKPR